MRICVLGLWHLGSVLASGLAALGHQVIGLDFDEPRVARLNCGIAPIFEPGLEDLIKRGLSGGNLRFSSLIDTAAKEADVLWVAYDTPIDDEHAGARFILEQIERAIAKMGADTVMLISSQLPVGSVRRLEQTAPLCGGSRQLRVAYCPENLRLGMAVNDFLHPDRIIVGVRSARDKEFLEGLLSPICESIEWMSIESAEMAKHAINAFFATSIAFANEIAAICESVGADAKDVERGLKTERRIGSKAYLAPGAAFAGGTLGRDVAFLNRASRDAGVATPLLSSVLSSNENHKLWVQKKLRSSFADLSRTTVTVWGLTYKPDTDTLRGSLSVELCDWLIREGAAVHVHDPRVRDLPAHWHEAVRRYDDPLDAVHGAHALVVGTESAVYRSISGVQLQQRSERLVVLDANRYLSNWPAAGGSLRYFAVGVATMDG